MATAKEKVEKKVSPSEHCACKGKNSGIEYIATCLKDAEKYNLLAEVVWTALGLIRNDNNLSPADALKGACMEWDV